MVWDGAGVNDLRSPPQQPLSAALPVLERGVRSDPVRCGYKGAERSGACAQSSRLFTAAGEWRAAGARAKFAKKEKKKESSRKKRRRSCTGSGSARPWRKRGGFWGKGGLRQPPSGLFSTAQRSTPNFREGKGCVGKGRSPGLKSRGLSWAGGPGRALERSPGSPLKLGIAKRVLEVVGEAMEGSEAGGIGS